MTKYRKKPVIVEAIKVIFGKTETKEIIDFVGRNNLIDECTKYPKIVKLEGNFLISDGDYIIKGIKGEFYPCKPDIFEDTYEPVIESNLLSSVMNAYGFTVEQARTMLANKVIKDILVDNMRTKKGPLRNATINLTTNIDTDKIIDRFTKKLEEELTMLH